MSPPEHVVRLLRIAEDDLNEIITYIAADRPSAAAALARKIEKNLRLFSTQSYLGRISDEEGLVRLGYRYLECGIPHGARDYAGLL